MKPTLEQVKAFMERDVEEERIPGPYEISLRFAEALLASGRYADDQSAAVDTAWTLIIPYYQGKSLYERDIRMRFDIAQHASQAEGDMTAGEAHAYVTGGETGQIGEMGAAPMHRVSRRVQRGPIGSASIDLEAAAKAQRIADATAHIIAIQGERDKEAALCHADPDRDRTALNNLQQAFDEAAKVQSEAYL